MCFIIGGADGLADSLRERAKLKLAFGALTWRRQLRARRCCSSSLSRRHRLWPATRITGRELRSALAPAGAELKCS